MGWELRLVPPGWQHPADPTEPSGYKQLRDRWSWTCTDPITPTWIRAGSAEWAENGGDDGRWMPDVSWESRPWVGVYCTVSDVPLSPAFATVGELADWCASRPGFPGFQDYFGDRRRWSRRRWARALEAAAAFPALPLWPRVVA